MKYPGAELLHLGTEHTRLRDHIVSTEQLVLRVLGFNLNVELPYTFLYNMLRQLNATESFARLATAVLNDFYAFSFILEFEAPILAAAALFFAAQISGSSFVERFKDEINLAEGLVIGGGESSVDPKSRTLPVDCLAAMKLSDSLSACIDISTRMMKNYSLPAPPAFTFDRKAENEANVQP